MDPADFYTGIVPEVYRALRGTVFPASRYRSFIAEHGTPALELGCGDSGPFHELVTEVDIDGVDSSIDMVRRARDRLAHKGLQNAVHHQRMEELDLSRRYTSIFLAGPTFNLLPDDATGLRALNRIAAHLAPAGAALVPLWTPPPTPAEEIGVTRVASTALGQARYTILAEDYDPASRTRTTRTRYELGSDSNERDWIVHWYQPESFGVLAAEAGLEATFTAIDDNETEAILVHR